jgi:hypothetical protein
MQSKLSLTTLIILLFIGLYGCSGKEQPSIKPKFSDNEKVIDSIKNAYQAQVIEFENWEADDATDSTLTVCIVNSKKLPSKDPDIALKEINSIASDIRNSLLDKTSYKSYYIIFVKTDTVGLMQTRSHTAGADVSVELLKP